MGSSDHAPGESVYQATQDDDLQTLAALISGQDVACETA